jgi:hypothetical protein
MISVKVKHTGVWIKLLCFIALIQLSITIDDASEADGNPLANEDTHSAKEGVHATVNVASNGSEDTGVLNNEPIVDSDVKSNVVHHAVQLCIFFNGTFKSVIVCTSAR